MRPWLRSRNYDDINEDMTSRVKQVIKSLVVIIELLISTILFLFGIKAYQDYQLKKAGYGTLGILEWGGPPILWIGGLFILSFITLIVVFGLWRRKRWGWIGSMILAILIPILLPTLVGPPMCPAAALMPLALFGVGLIFSIVLMILLFLIKRDSEKKRINSPKS